MKRKEAIIRQLGQVGWATRHQIAEAIRAPLTTVSQRLSELKKAGIVRNVVWHDGSRVWVLTEEGGRRFEYYVKRDRKRKRGERERRGAD